MVVRAFSIRFRVSNNYQASYHLQGKLFFISNSTKFCTREHDNITKSLDIFNF